MAKRTATFALATLAVVLALPGYWLLFTTLMAHDDEGYVLITLKNYSDHGGLYSHVFSQYGPFFYFFHDLAHRIFSYEFTNTTARIFTLGCWVIASFACAHLIWQQTRAWLLTIATLLLTFVYLQLMVSEPIHPGGLIAALVALAAWGGAEFINRNVIRGLAIFTGIIGAALVLIKINVGLFFILGSGTWFALHLPSTCHSRTSTIVTAILLAILPLALMNAALDKTWAGQFAALFLIASLAVITAAWRNRSEITQWKFAAYGIASALALTAITIICVCWRGTSLAELFHGVVLSPLRQPGIYHYAPDWKPASTLVAAISMALALAYRFVPKFSFIGLLVGIRFLIGISVGLAACGWFPFSLHSSVMSYVVPLSWIFVIPLAPNRTQQQSSATLWVGLLMVLQYLHAYPVAGSQIAWGTFLAIPLIALGLYDTFVFFQKRRLTFVVPALYYSLLALAIISVSQLSLLGWTRYSESRPLGLPGAEDLRPPAEFSAPLRMLTLNAVAHGDMLFSLPGMFSFNQWTQLPTPTLNNTTHWFTLLNTQQQQEIADALTRSARPIIIVHQGMLAFLAESHFKISSPLHDFIEQNFSRAFRVGEFELWVRRNRHIIPIGTAEFLRLNTPAADAPTYKLELVIALQTKDKIARLDLVTSDDKPVVLHSWSPDDGPLFYTPLTLEGHPAGTESNRGWMSPLPPLARLYLALPNADIPDRKNSMILVKDSEGRILAETQFVE